MTFRFLNPEPNRLTSFQMANIASSGPSLVIPGHGVSLTHEWWVENSSPYTEDIGPSLVYDSGTGNVSLEGTTTQYGGPPPLTDLEDATGLLAWYHHTGLKNAKGVLGTGSLSVDPSGGVTIGALFQVFSADSGPMFYVAGLNSEEQPQGSIMGATGDGESAVQAALTGGTLFSQDDPICVGPTYNSLPTPWLLMIGYLGPTKGDCWLRVNGVTYTGSGSEDLLLVSDVETLAFAQILDIGADSYSRWHMLHEGELTTQNIEDIETWATGG
jgi:hypothetical protein